MSTDIYNGPIITRQEAKEQGLNHYCTGIPCKRGHVVQRYVSDGTCVECDRERLRKRYAENAEQERERNRKYRQENPEKKREINRKWYAENAEQVRESARKWQKDNPEKRRDVVRKSYAKRVGKSLDEMDIRRPKQDPSKYLYLLIVKKQEQKLFIKVGITNNPEKRFRTHSRKLARNGLAFDTLILKDCGTEECSRSLENKIKTSFINYESGIEGFQDECILYNELFENKILKLINS